MDLWPVEEVPKMVNYCMNGARDPVSNPGKNLVSMVLASIDIIYRVRHSPTLASTVLKCVSRAKLHDDPS